MDFRDCGLTGRTGPSATAIQVIELGEKIVIPEGVVKRIFGERSRGSGSSIVESARAGVMGRPVATKHE